MEVTLMLDLPSGALEGRNVKLMLMLIMAEQLPITHMVEPPTADEQFSATHVASDLQKLMVDTDLATMPCLVILSSQDLVSVITQEEFLAEANEQLNLDGDTVTMPCLVTPISQDLVSVITQEEFSAVKPTFVFH